MYFFAVSLLILNITIQAYSKDDPTTERKVAALELNKNQQIYFENNMKDYASSLVKKYTVEFNMEGIYIIMDHKNCTTPLGNFQTLLYLSNPTIK